MRWSQFAATSFMRPWVWTLYCKKTHAVVSWQTENMYLLLWRCWTLLISSISKDLQKAGRVMWESSGKKLGYAMNIPDTWRLERRRSESTCQSCQQRRWVHLRVSKTEKFKYLMWSQQRGGNYFLSVSSDKKPSESDRRSWSWNRTPWDIEPSTRRMILAFLLRTNSVFSTEFWMCALVPPTMRHQTMPASVPPTVYHWALNCSPFFKGVAACS